jgi:hypothetical protein
VKKECSNIIFNYLLSYQTQKKYSLESFEAAVQQNKENMLSEYRSFLTSVVYDLLYLDSKIRDPNRVLVRPCDFCKRNNSYSTPGQQMEVDQLIETEQKKRQEIVDKDMISFGSLVRMLDYMILEAFVSSSIQAFKFAKSVIQQDMSAVFQIEPIFTKEGTISFEPPLQKLQSVIGQNLQEALVTLNSLPIAIFTPSLRIQLRSSK